MSVIEGLKAIGRQLDEELPSVESDRMAFKCLAGIWAMGALAMGAEAGIDLASQGTPINSQVIGSTAIALVSAGVSKFFWDRGQAPQETASSGE